jgi:hypothetical protein
MKKHLCHAADCKTEVAPKFLMCAAHWRRVPRNLQLNVYRHYRAGQEQDKSPTREYLKAAQNAIESINQSQN